MCMPTRRHYPDKTLSEIDLIQMGTGVIVTDGRKLVCGHTAAPTNIKTILPVDLLYVVKFIPSGEE